MTIHEMLEVVEVALRNMDKTVKAVVSLEVVEDASGDIFLLDSSKRLGIDPYVTATILGLLNDEELNTEIYEAGKVLLY